MASALVMENECSDCNYSLAMSDGSNTPDELEIDARSGVISIVKHADLLTTYSVDLTVTTAADELRIEHFVIDIECGPESTILTAPFENIRHEQVPGLTPAWNMEAAFTSSNANCPVVSHQLIGYSEHLFNLVDNDQSFIIELKDNKNVI